MLKVWKWEWGMMDELADHDIIVVKQAIFGIIECNHFDKGVRMQERSVIELH